MLSAFLQTSKIIEGRIDSFSGLEGLLSGEFLISGEFQESSNLHATILSLSTILILEQQFMQSLIQDFEVAEKIDFDQAFIDRESFSEIEIAVSDLNLNTDFCQVLNATFELK